MSLSRDDIDKVLRLSHLDLDESEKMAMIPQLEKVLDHITLLDKLSLEGVLPSSWANESPAPEREDMVMASTMAPLSNNAPKWTEGAFVVPKIAGSES